MSEYLKGLSALLSPKIRGAFKGSARLEFKNLGVIRLSNDGAEIEETPSEADLTLCATKTTFAGILDGTQNPMMAYMSGKLEVRGSTSRALKVSSLLAARDG